MRVNFTVTVTAGTPVNVATALNSVAMVAAGFANGAPLPRKLVNRLFIQMIHGGSGRGYVMDGIQGVTSATQQWRVPDATVSTDMTAELAPATATAPGGSYGDSDNDHGIDVSKTWVDGSNTGDKIQISIDLRV